MLQRAAVHGEEEERAFYLPEEQIWAAHQPGMALLVPARGWVLFGIAREHPSSLGSVWRVQHELTPKPGTQISSFLGKYPPFWINIHLSGQISTFLGKVWWRFGLERVGGRECLDTALSTDFRWVLVGHTGHSWVSLNFHPKKMHFYTALWCEMDKIDNFCLCISQSYKCCPLWREILVSLFE